MPRYGFASPGAQAGDAIQKFLVERALMQRQQQMDAFAKQKQDEATAQQAAELKLRQEQEQRIAEAQKATIADAENQRAFGRATTIYENAMPGDKADAQTGALLQQQGYGGGLTKVPGVVAQGTFQGNDAQDIPQYDVTQTPDSFTMRGGSKYLSARAAEDARAAQAGEAQTAREEEAARQREFQAGQNELTRQNARAMAGGQHGLQDELTRLRIDQARGTMDAASQARDKATSDAQAVTQGALTQLERLKTHPGLAKAQGAYEMRGRTQDAQNFNAIRDQVVNTLALPNLGALKGPMSDKDVAFVKSISTRLGNHNIDEAEAVKAIDEAIAFLQDKLQGGATPTDPTATTGAGATATAGTGGGKSSFRVVKRH